MERKASSRHDAIKRLLRRREWRLEQLRLQRHEKHKQQKIYEYEILRALEKVLVPPKHPKRSKSQRKSRRSRHRRHSKSSSTNTTIVSESSESSDETVPLRHCKSSSTNTPIVSGRLQWADETVPFRHCKSSSTNTPIVSGRLESADETVPLFKGPEGTKIIAAELHRIKVDIHRNIPGKSTDLDLQRDIIFPEDVIVKRRAGEGSKPIFEREEIKGVVTETEVEERRTVVTVNNDTLENKSSSPIRSRSHSPRRTLSRHSRSREHEDGNREKEKQCTESHNVEEERNRRSPDHLRSRDREELEWDRDFYHRDEWTHREYREIRTDYSLNTTGGDRSREQGVPPPNYMEAIPVPRSGEQGVPPPNYMEPIPVPIYYSLFLGNRHPFMMRSLYATREEVLLENRHPFMMRRPRFSFLPRLPPCDPIEYRSRKF